MKHEGEMQGKENDGLKRKFFVLANFYSLKFEKKIGNLRNTCQKF